MLRIFNHSVSKVVSGLLLAELIILLASTYVGAALRFSGGTFPFSKDNEHFFVTALAYTLSMLFSMSALGMYKFSFREGFRNTFLRLMPASALSFAIMTLVFYLMPDLLLGRGTLGIVVIVAAVGIMVGRILFFKSSESKLLESRIIFLGAGALARECGNLAMHNFQYHKYRIMGFVPMTGEVCCVPAASILPAGQSLVSLAKRFNAGEIIVSVTNRRSGGFPIQELLECKLNGIKVIDAASFFEREANQIRVDSLQPSWLVFGTGFDQSFLRTIGKRFFDIVVSLVIFLVSLPAMLITGLLIFIEDGAPVFYQQERVGLNGKTFIVLKFRSMTNNAEKAGKPQWAASDDPRTTRVGRVIRKLRIDELPQILNVLKGDMSFVGPRPERPFFVKQLCQDVPFYNARHSIKPGITGLAQVRYQYGASVEDSIQKLQYDLYYVKNNSLFLDMLILIDTLQVVIFGKGQ
ncbi:MAG: TIGR03013 family PEP-CTERM/XrtA system glycosyltransferase [Herminiimonas sp.]|nr:TIGR03013 family PEP-CTERM/XrtA system glycosyltransferase [Herminiimonas sp.]